MKGIIKNILLGLGIFVLGLLIIGYLSSYFQHGNIEHGYLYGIIFSTLYLSSVVGISTSLILRKLDYNSK